MAASGFTSANGLPVASGIELVPTRRLPDRIRKLFPFPFFNAVQSKSFHTVYNTSDNLVVSAPTGSGKTALLELAICSYVASASSTTTPAFKVVYQAPTKALCSERCRDWQSKFTHLNLRCEELTGDTELAQLKHVQNADILVTTPEKWDSITRKWKDHKRLMDLVKLFLVDEVHILKEDRGACLEAVVSRMKSIANDVRFIALSATVPNSDDIAQWLGRSSLEPGLPAACYVFDERFRPVRLEKHVVGISSGANDFSFDQICTQSLPDIIVKYGKRKPIMVFCMTRTSAERTAAALADWWLQTRVSERPWAEPKAGLVLSDDKLRQLAGTGVAYHHAGIDMNDRLGIEQGYLTGNINVICCTSTLAVGINLPCHFVIVKNTVSYHSETMSCQEYSDLDMMQMMGRAGRPQFDTSALAVILTRQEKVTKYERMVQGQEVLESRLHLNLLEHLNSEIGLCTIQDMPSACAWLEGTFLAVRLSKNPEHYRLDGDAPALDFKSRFEEICKRALLSLQDLGLVEGDRFLRSTQLGDAMSRYCICFDTMKLIVQISPRARMSEILSVIAQAAEFKTIRFRQNEKAMFKEINSSPLVRFPIKVNLDVPAQKVSLIIQSALGGVDLRNDQKFAAQQRQYAADMNVIFLHTQRLAKCIIDCQLCRKDAESVRNAMELSRSLGARAWDDSPLQLAQLDKLGPVAVRKLIGSNIKTVEDLENTENFRIEMILNRNPPFGSEILAKARDFPKLRVSLKALGKPAKCSTCVKLQVKAELGFVNETPPISFKRIPIQVCFLAETSDGRVAHFCRISGKNLGQGQEAAFIAELEDAHQLVSGYISCEDIAGTLQYATLDPKLPPGLFAGLRVKFKAAPASKEANRPGSRPLSDEFADDLDDEDLRDVVDCVGTASTARGVANNPAAGAQKRTLAGAGKPRTPNALTGRSTGPNVESDRSQTASKPDWNPVRLPNGNWKCSHRCKNKQTCSHRCCREGTENKPKPPKSALEKNEGYQQSSIFQAMQRRQNAVDARDERMSARPQLSHAASAVGRQSALSEEFDDIDELSSDTWEKELALELDKGQSKQISGKGQSLFMTDSSSPLKQADVEVIDFSSEAGLRDETQQPAPSSTRPKRPLEHDTSPKLAPKRAATATRPRIPNLSQRITARREATPPTVVVDAVDFSSARLEDEDLFPDVADPCNDEQPSAAAEAETMPSNTTVLASSSGNAQKPRGKSPEWRPGCGRKATQEEIDAFLMQEFGDVVNFV